MIPTVRSLKTLSLAAVPKRKKNELKEMAKKRKDEAQAVAENGEEKKREDESELVNGDAKKKKRKKEKNWGKEMPTVSIAVPGSIIDNAQSLELATRLAGQIARAATIFRIDEVAKICVQSCTRQMHSCEYLPMCERAFREGGNQKKTPSIHCNRRPMFVVPKRKKNELKEMAKKRRDEAQAVAENGEEKKREDESELVNGDAKKKKRKKEKNWGKEMPTVSIAVPGSIIDNAQSLELATRLAGQIARAATIFRIDEVVVFDNKSTSAHDFGVTTTEDADGSESGAPFLMRILQYLETPQYLRRTLFPRHNSLRFVGLLPPLDAPHHLRKHEWAKYREGVTLKDKAPNSVGTVVDVGLSKNVVIDQVLEPGTRVTVAMGTNRHLESDCFHKIVSSTKPREEEGLYWGYKVRYACNISSLIKECPYKGGYDHLIGTSEHGLIVNSSELTIPTFRHLLIAFGGLAGLEESIEEDSTLKGKIVQEVFDSYLNTCPHQGSRTIRTEEAIFISLQYFQEPINRVVQRYEN